MVKFLNGVPSRLVHDFQQSLLLLQHLSPLDLDLNGLALPSGRHSGLLQHGCTGHMLHQSQSTWPWATSHACIKFCRGDCPRALGQEHQPVACGSMNRLPLVPADRSMQAWPMATPTPTVLICAK